METVVYLTLVDCGRAGVGDVGLVNEVLGSPKLSGKRHKNLPQFPATVRSPRHTRTLYRLAQAAGQLPRKSPSSPGNVIIYTYQIYVELRIVTPLQELSSC